MSGKIRPPEGLRKIAREAAALPPCRHWLDVGETKTCVDCIVDAVLAALLEACEVRERWGTRWINGDIEMTTAWWTSREEAEIELACPTRSLALELVRRCDLRTPVEVVRRIGPENEPVAPAGEEKTDA